jgi:hypothetical protein
VWPDAFLPTESCRYRLAYEPPPIFVSPNGDYNVHQLHSTLSSGSTEDIGSLLWSFDTNTLPKTMSTWMAKFATQLSWVDKPLFDISSFSKYLAWTLPDNIRNAVFQGLTRPSSIPNEQEGQGITSSCFFSNRKRECDYVRKYYSK